jgi:DNA topoisomerase VI subunit A
MFQSGDIMQPNEANRDPRRIHAADKMYAQARNHLDKIIEHVKELEPDIYTVSGNTDSSVLYDWLKGYIKVAEDKASELSEAQGKAARDMTLLMCAAAITRLVWASRTDNDPLAQLDWKEPEQ